VQVQATTPFDPTQYKFIQLRYFQIPGDVPVYEYANHSAVDGTKDFSRLNLYLTKDGTYVTIWWGLEDVAWLDCTAEIRARGGLTRSGIGESNVMTLRHSVHFS
jgi:hypothetical protein